MKHRILCLLACLWACVQMVAQGNEVEVTPLFSVEGLQAQTMYCDGKAEKFYLHTDSMRYVVSREGEVLSREPGKVRYGCCDNDTIYVRSFGENCILNEFNDTVVVCNASDFSRLRCFDKYRNQYCGWSGTGQSRSNFFGDYCDGRFTRLMWSVGKIILGVALSEHTLHFISSGSEATGIWHADLTKETGSYMYQTTMEIIRDFRQAIGLALVDSMFYTWSNETETMYMIKQKEDATSVDYVTLPTDDTLYSLDGKTLQSVPRGIYIQNGKKVMVR